MAWSAHDFLDISSRFAVEKALQRLLSQKSIRRLHRGLFGLASNGQEGNLKHLLHPVHYINAIARREHARVLIDANTAASFLGLVADVPAEALILTSKHSRLVSVTTDQPNTSGRYGCQLHFKRATGSKMYWAGRPAMLLVQATTWIAKGEYKSDFSKWLNDFILDNGSIFSIERDINCNWSMVPEEARPFLQELIKNNS